MSKPNKDGWIRHRGGKCPVEAGVLVDVRYRNGKVNEHVKALVHENAGGSINLFTAANWKHGTGSRDIMAYRIHKPAEQPVSEIELCSSVTKEMIFGSASQAEGPLQWRDRITEIDTTVEALEEERASLMQRLEAEGFRLIERAVQPVEDMSNPKNWKNGDLITFVLDRKDKCFTTGKQYIFIGRDKYGAAGVAKDDQGDRNGWCFEYFKFHSRPSK